MKARGKLVSLLMALVCLLPLGAGLLGFGDSASAAIEDITVTLHKKKMDDFPTEGLENTGELMEGDDQFGKYDPLPGIDFTAYDVTEDFYRLLNATGNETEDEYNAKVKALMESFELADATNAAKVGTTQTTDDDGTATFTGLKNKDDNGVYKVYLFEEENATADMKYKSPVMLVLPVLNAAKTEQLDTIHLYPKNKVENEPEKEITDSDGNTLPDADRYSYDVGKKIYYKASFVIPNQIGEVITNASGNQQTRYSKLVFKDNVDQDGVKFESIEKILIDDQPINQIEFLGTTYSNTQYFNQDPSYDAIGTKAGFEIAMKLNESDDKAGGGVDYAISRNTANYLGQYRGKKIEIFYSVSLTEDTPVDRDINNNFSVTMKQDGKSEDKKNADNPPVVTTGGKKFLKHEDKVESQGLGGAEFVVIKEATPGNEFYLKKENGKWSWAAVTGDYDDAWKATSDKDGNFEVTGLEFGDYKLRETKAPDGFNKGQDVPFVIDKGSYDGSAAETKGVPNVSKGGFLPSTGGIGIVIFLVIGGSLMAFAVNRYRKQQRTA